MGQDTFSLEQRVIELETKLSFQDDLLHSLNDIVAEQNRRVSELESKISTLAGHLKEAIHSNQLAHNVDDEVPPHY